MCIEKTANITYVMENGANGWDRFVERAESKSIAYSEIETK